MGIAILHLEKWKEREREKKGDKEEEDKVIEHHTETQTCMDEDTMAAIWEQSEELLDSMRLGFEKANWHGTLQ